MSEMAVEVRGLIKRFKVRGIDLPLGLARWTAPRTVTALGGIDVAVNRGECFALLGPNGSGKTTLLKILATLLSPDAGQVRVFGTDLLKEPERVKPSISFLVGEERGFYWRLTGRQNLEFFSALYGLSKKASDEKVNEVIELFEIEEPDKPYQTYSTGVKHRLALARCFLTPAKLILMDEPTRSLDPNAAATLRELIKSNLRGRDRTFLFTTHDTLEAEELADCIAIIDHGKITACGTFQELRKSAGSEAGSLTDIFRHLVVKEG